MSQYMSNAVVMDVQRPVTLPPTNIIPPPPTQGLGPETPLPPSQTPEIKKPGRRKGPIIAIIAIVITVLILIAGAVFFYLRTQNAAEEPAAQAPIEAPIEDDGTVDPEDIDAAVQKIDGSLTNLNDSADFGADDLNDTTLGF